MKKYTQEELEIILEKHRKWLYDEEGGERADLRYADLRSADLNYADLGSANLSSANLNSANLNSAISDLRFISLSSLGSKKRMTTYCFDSDTVWCGCFNGTLEEFEKKVNETHKINKQYLKEYLGAINYIKSLKEE